MSKNSRKQTKFGSLLSLMHHFSSDEVCIEHIKQLHWKNGVYCPHCQCKKVYHFKDGKRYKCAKCRKKFSYKVGTIFSNTKIPLQKWFVAIYLITSHKKGISSLQLSRDIGITQKSAWVILHKIRATLKHKTPSLLSNEVEVDETYVGGKNKNRHANKKVRNARGRSFKDKTPVLGLLERKGKVVAKVVTDVSEKTLTTHVNHFVSKGAKVYTDEWLGYINLRKMYDHSIVKHGQKEYVNGDTHTNTLEGFWSLLKRGIIGVYHYTSKKHLNKYLDEFTYRYNTRHIPQETRFNRSIHYREKVITYNSLTSKVA